MAIPPEHADLRWHCPHHPEFFSDLQGALQHITDEHEECLSCTGETTLLNAMIAGTAWVAYLRPDPFGNLPSSAH